MYVQKQKKNKISMFVLLDLNKTFDTVNHKILPNNLISIIFTPSGSVAT